VKVKVKKLKLKVTRSLSAERGPQVKRECVVSAKYPQNVKRCRRQMVQKVLDPPEKFTCRNLFHFSVSFQFFVWHPKGVKDE
jgi:hypothetical protein